MASAMVGMGEGGRNIQDSLWGHTRRIGSVS